MGTGIAHRVPPDPRLPTGAPSPGSRPGIPLQKGRAKLGHLWETSGLPGPAFREESGSKRSGGDQILFPRQRRERLHLRERPAAPPGPDPGPGSVTASPRPGTGTGAAAVPALLGTRREPALSPPHRSLTASAALLRGISSSFCSMAQIVTIQRKKPYSFLC